MARFVTDDVGYTVPYLDIEEAAEKLCLLYQNREMRVQKGVAARAKVEQQHDIKSVAPEIVRLIKETIAHQDVAESFA